MAGQRNGGKGAGYGALQSAGAGAADPHVHAPALAFEPSRSRGRLVAVSSALVATVLAVAVLALASTGPPSAGRTVALSGASLGSINPTALLSLPARATSLVEGSGLSPKVEPFPNIKYNVFDPKAFPEPPHHRWSEKKLREEARLLTLLVNEAKSWEDKKYKAEIGDMTTKFDKNAWIDQDLSNITGIEKQAQKHMRAIYEGLRVANRGIAAAAVTTGSLQQSIEHGEDRTVRKVWELIYEFGKDFDFQKLIQDYIARQARMDMAADGKMDYLKVNRYNGEVEEQKQRIHGWIEGLRGRIGQNFTHISHESEKLQHLYEQLRKDDGARFLEAFVKAQHLSTQVGEAVKKGANLGVRLKQTDQHVQQFQTAFATVTGNAQKVSDGVDALDKTMSDQHIKDVEDMLPLTEKFDSLKSKLSMLITSLSTVEGVMRDVQEKHSALKIDEDEEMDKLKQSVEDLKPRLQSILDLDAVIKSLRDDSQTKIDAASTHFDAVKSAEGKVDVDDIALQEQMQLINHTTSEQEKFVHANGYMSSYADIEHMLTPASLQVDEVDRLYSNVNKTDSDLKVWAIKLMTKETKMLQERKDWAERAAGTDAQLKEKFNATIWREQSGIQQMFAAIADVKNKIQKAKEFRESSLALHNQLRQQLAETTQSLEEMDKKFGELYSALGKEISRIGNSTDDLALPEDIKQGEDNVNLQAQESLDKSKEEKPEVNFLKEREKSEAERLRKMQDHLKTIKTESNMAIMKAKELLRRHPNLFERISCVCYDGDKLNGKCIAGSLADESTCDPCPAGSYCLRGEEYPCKTTCPGGMVLTGTCPIGSISDVTTCVPSPAGHYSENGVATPCRTRCDDGFELRGSCPVGSSSDTTRCASCPAGFFCKDGETNECKSSCGAGLVLTGKCPRGMSVDVTTCDPSPAGHYSETGVAMPCKTTCESGKYLTDECPAGSTSDTSSCTECPEGSFCTGGEAISCKTTCENGELLTGSCPPGSGEDVTVCVRCPEGNFCEDGKAIPCRTTCPGGKYLQGRCRKGSTEDTTTCRTCKSGNFCADGVMTPCKKECQQGYTLEGQCERGSDHDSTTCEGCPEDFYCTSYAKYECKRRCWEGKILRGKCEVGSYEDTTSCDKCPAGEYCKRGVATPCKTECEDGFLLSGECAEGSSTDSTICKSCPAGSFCKDNKQEPCKTTCPDGQLLQGFCRAGSSEDKTECAPCPAGSFCVDGKAQECVDSCPNGKKLTGSCEEGSSTAITTCEPCPAGTFCRNNEVEACKTSCPAGQFLVGECEEGSSKDETTCSTCPEGSFCVDGKQEKCKETCPAGQQLNGKCLAGSSQDETTCDACPAGFFCTDAIAESCKTKSSCALGEQFVGECAAGSERDVTSCDPCPPGSYCRGGDARPCRTIIDCNDGQKLDRTCPEGSSMNPVCKPCRAGVFCVEGEETPCKASCDAGMVLEGFCASGSPSDTTQCNRVAAGSYAVDGAAVPCLTTCESGKLLGGSCPEGSTEDGMTCTPCPEGFWCENGRQETCTTGCLNGQLLKGECPAGSKADMVVCESCPSGSFCTDNQITPCKTECPDGKFLEGECAAGSAEDTTHCTPCPSGVFCKDGTQTPCTSTCDDGQELQGFCAAGSTEDTVSCSPCPAGSFCTGGVALPCKTTCDDGEEFKGVCAEGSGTDTTTCEVCPQGFYCQDGLKAQCKTSCPVVLPPLELKGECSAGSVTDTTSCLSDATPLPKLVYWWKSKSASNNIGQSLTRGVDGSAGAETRLVGSVGTAGFIEGRVKMPLNAKWNVQFSAFWPKYDAGAAKDGSVGSYPLQGYGEQVEDTISATMNGEEIPMPMPMDKRGKKKQLGQGVYFMKDFEGDELVWRFDFTSQTPEPSARPYIVAGEITLLHDDTTDDEGAGFETGNGGMGHSRGTTIKGKIKNAIDGKKLRPGWKGVNDGFNKDGLILKEDARLMLFKKSQLITQIRVVGSRFQLKIEEGDYTCVAVMPGLMAFYDENCKVEGKKMLRDIFMSPFVVPGEVRTVLTWGKDRDLDAFLLAPHQQVTDPPCEVNWSNKECSSGSVQLDKDDKKGFGPETITAHNLRVGRYRYRVSEYKGADDNRASLLASKAQVTVYTATDVRVFEIKHSGAGAGFIRGNSWYVFTIDGETSKIYPCNEDSCGNGYHDPKGAGRRRLLHHVDPEDKL